MDKHTIKAEMREFVKGAFYMNVQEIARFYGRGRNGVSEMINGLDYIRIGKQKCFSINDLAQKQMDRREYQSG